MTKYADYAHRKPMQTAFALALGAAISLGLARFSYGLFLPIMREDLGWTYFIAGTMNTANAAGYFIGALLTSWCFRKTSVANTFIAAALLTSLLIGLSGYVTDVAFLFILRLLSGITSALVFVGGGVLAAQLGSLHVKRSGLLLGIYYGGTGLGIVLSSLLVPSVTELARQNHMEHAWQPAWWALALTGLVLGLLLIKASLSVPAAPPRKAGAQSTAVKRYVFIVLGYCCFGMGYIGYMTFVIALLKQMGVASLAIYTFYALLGFFVMASSRIWARLLDKYRGGQSMAILNTLLGIACFIPAGIALKIGSGESGAGVGAQVAQGLSQLGLIELTAIYLSGVIFGACFLSAVASTTAFVKHNLPQPQWVAGITVFTSIFALGQILGPSLVGWIADGPGGLARGLLLSGGILLTGAFFAWLQKPLAPTA